MLVAGGLESVSLVQNEHMNTLSCAEDPWLLEHKPEIYMTMIATAEIVAERYGIGRERQDAYALRSQHRTAAAQRRGASTPRSCQSRPSGASSIDDTGEAHLRSGDAERATKATGPTPRPTAWPRCSR